jgi:4-amino-4-deoxy-L-arabinose transferase-like glycosyltransferase
LRLWQNDLTPFLDDEAVLLSAAARMLDTHHVPLEAGLALSIHVNEPPLVVFLAAAPMLISRNPIWVSACLTAVDAFATVFVYRAAERLAGRFAGFVAALLFAVAPAAVYFSRRIYYSELVPFCCAVAMLALIDVWQRKSATSLAVALVASACAAELHASAAVLLLVWLVVAACSWRWLPSRRPLGIAALIVLATLAPYAYLQTQTGWADLAGVLRFMRETKQLDASALDQALTVIGGGIYRQLLLPFPRPAPRFWLDAPGWFLVGLVAIGAGLAVIKRSPAHLTVLALLVLPALASLRHTTDVLPYYLLPALPPATILAGMAVAAVPWRLAGLAMAAVPVLWQVGGYLNLQRVVAADGQDLNYGMPLRYEVAAARMLAELPAGARLSVSEIGNQAATFPYLTAQRFQIAASDSRFGVSFKAPDGSPSHYLIQGGGHVYSFFSQDFGPPLGVVATSSGRPAFGLFQAPPDAVARVDSELTPVDANVAEVVRIVGYSAPNLAAGQPSTLLLGWQVTDPTAQIPSEVQQFAHLVDRDGRGWSTNEDERAYPRAHWQMGDVVLTWFDLGPKPGTPTGGYWIETGFYGYVTNQPLLVSAGSGSPSASLRVGPLRLSGPPTAAPAMAPMAVFGDGEIALLAASRKGNDVTLTWQALGQPRGDYTVFVHLLDANGRLIAQHDGLPVASSFPTRLWRAGDVISDIHHLDGEDTGGARLEIGLYTSPDSRRIETAAGGDHVETPS